MSILGQLIINSLIAGAIYTLVALGFSLIYRVTKFLNLAHGVMATIGGYMVFYLFKMLGLNLYLAIAVAVIFTGLVGYISNYLVFRRLRARRGSNLVLIVASLGVFTAIESLIAILFSSQFQTLSDNRSIVKIYSLIGGVVTQTQIVILLSGLAIMVGLILLLKFTLFGKAVRAIADDEEVAKVVGINTHKIVGRVFFICSAIAGLAGVLVGFDTGLTPIMGMGLLLKGVIAAIIGGVGNIWGAVVGSFVLGFIENFGIWKISSEWKDAIAFGILILFLIFRPQGLFGKK